jgi:bacterial/archaeal transporter family protein
MPDLPAWFLASLAVWALWGFVGITQKLTTNYLSAECATISLTLGYLLVLPFVISSFHPSSYSSRAMWLALGSGILNMLGGWTMFVAMRKGGQASIVMPLTALYPGIVALLSPRLFGDHISTRQILGILFGLASGVFLSRDSQ